MKFLNISQTMYYGLETGERTLNQEYLEKLSAFYEVSIDYIVGRTKHPQAYILEGDMLPKELRDIDVEYIELVKDAKNSGISKEDIKEIIEFYKFKKGLK